MKKLEKIIDSGMYGLKRTMFLTPMMYSTEILSGLENSQSLKSRAISAGVQFLIAEKYNNWFKPKVYDLLRVNESSPEYKKDMANRTAFALHQIPLYLGILSASGATMEQIAITLPTGVAVGVACAGKFQKFMDKASDFIENKYYKTKDTVSKSLELGKNYVKNLAYASLIAMSTKLAVDKIPNYVAENNIVSNKNSVLVMDNLQEGMYWIDKKNFDKRRHSLVE